MDPFNGATVNRVDGGLGRTTANSDNVSLLVIGNAIATAGLPLNAVKRVLDLKDLETMGITASYDDVNSILAHHHASEVFRLNPDVELYVVSTTPVSRNVEIVKAVRTFPQIKLLAIAANVTASPVAIAVEVAALKLEVIDELLQDKIRIDSILIGSDQFTAATAISAYPDLRALNTPNVSVILGQDPAVAAIKTAYANYAAVGTALGALSRRGVNENLGSVDANDKPDYAKGLNYWTLSDIARGLFLTAALQSGKNFAALTAAERQALNEKGYIFIGGYAGFAGFYFSNSPTCTAVTSDYAYIENNRVWNKAARGVRTALLPRVKRNVLKDPETGFVKTSEARELESVASKPLQDMVNAGEISAGDVYINPAQAFVGETALEVKATIVYNGIVFEFNVDLSGAQNI